MPSSTLTKTDYLAYAQCSKRLWLARHRPELAAPPDPAARRRLLAGQDVDRLARERFPEGCLIPYRPDPQEMAALTAKAIQQGAETLFQATIATADLLVKVDILARDGSGWHLIEVKSGTSYRADEHLVDTAFQAFVLRQAGLQLDRISLMHLNSACCYPDLSNLFQLTEVTDEVDAFLGQVAADILLIRPLMVQEDPPAKPISRHCQKPRSCPFHDHCWQDVSGPTINDIPYLKRPVEEALEAAGVLYLADIPDGRSLGDRRAESYVAAMNSRRVAIDAAAIRAALEALEFPLYFLDFETIDYAVPVYDGCHPYQQVPFQYSCHILEASGRLEHVDHLHTSPDDPRPDLVEALLHDIGDDGHLVAYNASFEAGVLRHLARHFPAQAVRLDRMADRLWDQLTVFRRHYQHHAFGGSNSLKAVLPVIVPGLGYDALVIRDGSQAQVAWEEMIHCEDPLRKAEMIDHLRAYCRLDTQAMVEVHRVLCAQ